MAAPPHPADPQTWPPAIPARLPPLRTAPAGSCRGLRPVRPERRVVVGMRGPAARPLVGSSRAGALAGPFRRQCGSIAASNAQGEREGGGDRGEERARSGGPDCRGANSGGEEGPSTGRRVAAERPAGGMLEILWPEGLALGAGMAIAAANGGDVSAYGPNPGGLAEAIAILAVIVAVHEGGHFLAARLQNIHVSKFSIGFGPALLKYQGQVVEYSLRAIPLGGFVSFPDDDPENPYPLDDPDLLRNRTIPERVLVVSAGVVANFVFAFAILLAQVCTVGVADRVYQPGVRIPSVTRKSVAESSGLKAGDIIISVDGVPVAAGASSVSNVVNAINDSAGQKLPLLINRSGKTLPIAVTPEKDVDGKGRIGLQLVSNASTVRTKATNVFQAMVLASNEISRMCGDVTRALQNFIGNFKGGELSGPLAAVAVGAEVAQVDSSQLFQFAAIININLAIVNILPVPALDGGFLALLLLEAARGGKKLPQGVENGVMASGWLALMMLGSILLVQDTLNLGIFQNLL
ncbi:unnamed protein product [Ostreobium quekettii]|uniref:PDZ domain-containing protein n=1 Tax=Ostreobium quekettii TaxID=121088 RepID=A0A8S1IRE2_9CHLO|nr:unnamed protein product [Ostreobium quekettii]|eukprot:evm.model.scf_56EXC.15 EVM.evm.TU.scf_56EXC.15   scf_56EXC:164768-168819(-)